MQNKKQTTNNKEEIEFWEFFFSCFLGSRAEKEQTNKKQTDRQTDGWMNGRTGSVAKGRVCCVFCDVYAKGYDGIRMAGLELELEMWSGAL